MMEELKKALATVINVSEATDDALQDGKISISEGVSIAFKAIGLISVIKNIKPIIAEWQTLTPDQITELSEWFSMEFDLVDDNLEGIIEMIFSALLKLSDVFELMKSE